LALLLNLFVNPYPNAGEWRQVAFSPPFSVIPGDTFRSEGNTVYQVRGGVDHDVRLITSSVQFTPPAADASQSISNLVFFRSSPMVPASATLVGVTEAPSGTITFDFSDGASEEFGDWETAVKGLADTVDADIAAARRILIARSYRLSPNGENKVNTVGGTITIDCAANTPVQFSE
jgi:hypothetical protein